MKQLHPEEISAWVKGVLFDEQRKNPVVAVTTQPHTECTWISPEALEDALGNMAEVVSLETGEATWELTDALPTRLDVYGGAVRIWWPNLREDSDPYDHRLYFIHSPHHAEAVFRDIVEAIKGPEKDVEPLPVSTVTVQGIDGGRVQLSGENHQGELRYADVPLEALRRCLEVGSQFQARPVRALADGLWEFSVQGLLPSPWECAADGIGVGDIITARAMALREKGVLMEVLPRVRGILYQSDVDWSYVTAENLSEFVTPGEVRPVKVMEFDPENQRLRLSMKEALPNLAGEPGPLPSLVPGGVAFTWPTSDVGEDTSEVPPDEHSATIASLTEELEAASADRKALRDKSRELKKQLRASEDRLQEIERRTAAELNPLSSDTGFLLGLRLTYAKMFDEGTRHQYPLQKLRVGASFLDSVRALDSRLDLDKILEVCVQVASGLAHKIDGREVHPLRGGPGGAPTVTRSSDKASAWRCALQVKTPSARRLHWWDVPGKDGKTIEFAKVGVHDDVSIPE